MKIKPIKKLKLYGFNNLTKTLSFNMYDICYAKTAEDRNAYLEYIDDEYNAERLTGILTEVANIIGANVLNIANQDYEPQGASVTILISEEKILNEQNSEDKEIDKETPGPAPRTYLGHLDKSHITVHTYPESHPDKGISSFRADIDVSTCGRISPLKALNYLIQCFNPDIAMIDYRVRGFTRDVTGKKFFIDHKINSIQNYIPDDIKNLYNMMDVNIFQENIFHTKMILKEFDLNNYLFRVDKSMFLPGEKKRVKNRLKKEMQEIYYGRNMPKV